MCLIPCKEISLEGSAKDSAHYNTFYKKVLFQANVLKHLYALS